MLYAFLVIFEVLRLCLRLMLVFSSYHFLSLALRAARGLRAERGDLPEAPQLPLVTVQIPMRNEYYVAERVIRRICALEYPRDRLEIQVLDDSDDESREIVRRCVEDLAAQGQPITLITRDEPRGYKAGALNEGLRRARGEYVAIFDADSLPPPDFLTETLPFFADPRVGLVQVRWEFINRGETLLTRLQSMILDGLFALDQHVKAGAGLPLQFNGTSGIWRKRCLEEAGPWSEDALTEDADLSFRAQVKGWQLVHHRDYAVPTELPRNMASFRTQQKRWATGSAQVLRRMAGQVLRSTLPWSAKLTMLLHMFRHVIFLLIFLSCVAAPGTTLFRMPFLVNYGAVPNLLMLLLLAGSLLVYHVAALRVTGQPWHRAALSPLVIPLLLGMSFIYSISFLRGLLFRGGEFVRTPKRGGTELDLRSAGPRYRSRRDPLALLEVLFGLTYGLFSFLLLRHGVYIHGTLFGGVAASFLWVGLGSLLARTPRG